MKTLKRALIVGGSSDELNTNSILRQFVAEGMQTAFPEALIVECGPDRARDHVRDLLPELVVIFGSIMLDDVDHLPAVETARRAGGRIAFWLHDDPYEFDSAYRALPMADVIFTNEVACLDFYPASVPVHHLPLGASIRHHFRPVTYRSGADLFFCGHMYRNRQDVLSGIESSSKLDAMNVVFCGSSDSPIVSPHWTGLRLSNAALADFNNTSLSVLNIGRDLDLANARFDVKSATPGPRTFEAAMSGATQIFFGPGHEIERYFEPGQECLRASSHEELVDHVARLKREPTTSIAIGSAAQARARRDHSYADRAKVLVSLV